MEAGAEEVEAGEEGVEDEEAAAAAVGGRGEDMTIDVLIQQGRGVDRSQGSKDPNDFSLLSFSRSRDRQTMLVNHGRRLVHVKLVLSIVAELSLLQSITKRCKSDVKAVRRPVCVQCVHCMQAPS